MSFHFKCLTKLEDELQRVGEYRNLPDLTALYSVNSLFLDEIARCRDHQKFDLDELNKCCFKVASNIDAASYPILNNTYEFLRQFSETDPPAANDNEPCDSQSNSSLNLEGVEE